MAAHLAIDGLAISSHRKVKFPIQSENAEEVAVWFAGRRTRSVIASFAEIVLTLMASDFEIRSMRHAFRKLMHCRRKIVNEPMRPGPGGSVRVVDNEQDRLRSGWRNCPGEAGETSSPEQVNFFGMMPPGAKAFVET